MIKKKTTKTNKQTNRAFGWHMPKPWHTSKASFRKYSWCIPLTYTSSAVWTHPKKTIPTKKYIIGECWGKTFKSLAHKTFMFCKLAHVQKILRSLLSFSKELNEMGCRSMLTSYIGYGPMEFKLDEQFIWMENFLLDIAMNITV